MELPIYRHFIDNLYMLRNQIKFEYRTYLENTSKIPVSKRFPVNSIFPNLNIMSQEIYPLNA